MHFVSIIRYSLVIVALLSGLATLQGQSVLIEADARPSVVMVGETSTYSIRFLNTTSIPSLNTPRVEGLDFSNTPSTSTSRQIINGISSVEVALSWTFRPARTGDFTIPGRYVTINGEETRIPDVDVRATPMDEERKTRALLHLDLPKPPYYVGQALPARLGLLVRRDLTLASVAFPEGDGDSFLNSEFANDPKRGTVQVEGRTYEALVWDILITPIKSGPGELKFSQDIALQVISRDSRFPSIFSMSRRQSEQMTLHTDTLSAEILPLPAEEMPDSFTDAIGQFEITSSLSTTELTVGEPLTLTLTFKGSGNFDRISPPELPEWDQWRQYPPKVTFTPDGPQRYSGTKSFEYILIPQDESIAEIPGLALSFFSPESATYTTTRLEAVPVQVKASDKPADTSPFGILQPDDNTEEARIPEKILPQQPEAGVLSPQGIDPWARPAFLMGNLLTALALLSCAAWQLRKRRLENDSQLARRHSGSRKVRKALQRAQAASRANDVEAFFDAARFAIQESVCHLSKKHIEANTLVTSDCLDILKTNNVPPSLQSKIEQILDAADAHQFAGLSPASGRILELHPILVSIISELSRFSK